MDPSARRKQHATVQGRREAVEQLAASLRKKIAAYRLEEARRGWFRAALVASLTATWIGRLEALAAELEQHAVALRAQEAGLDVAPAKVARPATKKRARGR